MAAAHHIPGDQPSETPYNHLVMPAPPAVSMTATENISIDDFSRSLLAKAPRGTRFSWVGWFIKENETFSLILSCRPGFSPTLTDAEKKAAEELFGKEIVFANVGNVGQVHDETIHLVNELRASQGISPLPNIRKGSPDGYPMIGFSSIKQNDESLACSWTNRSIYNTTSFAVDPLASARRLLRDEIYTQNIMYHIERSIPIRFFKKIVESIGKALEEKMLLAKPLWM